jgi:glycosyltransferase involved in cell wall biosynthesis
MACGVYPIASDIPANRQWVTDGLNGSLVKINDVDALAEKICYVYQHHQGLMTKVNEISDRIIAEKGTWQVNMAKMETIYKTLAASKK